MTHPSTAPNTTGPSPDWWPHDGHPHYLPDGVDDGLIEDHVLVPAKAVRVDANGVVRHHASLEAACIAFVRDCPGGARQHDDMARQGLRLQLDATTTWQRPDAVRHGDTWIHVDAGQPCDHCGPAAQITNPDTCETCDRTGRFTLRFEHHCPWVECQPNQTDAVEFFRLDVVEQASLTSVARAAGASHPDPVPRGGTRRHPTEVSCIPEIYDTLEG